VGKKNDYNKQFKDGYFPDQHWDESTRVNGHEPASPTEIRKRKGIAMGSQTEAYPGMSGKNDYPRKRGK